MTKKEIQRQRTKILMTIRKFEKKKYDARKLIPEFYRLTELFIQAGGDPPAPTGGLLKEYWDNPEHYSNECFNEWPITEVHDGDYKREYIRKAIALPVEPAKPEPTPQSKPIEPNYYRINITWDNDINYHIIEQFFNELCIDADRKLDDHSMSYIYFGGDEGFKILKRALMVMCGLIYPNSNVAVYGKQIKK